MTEQDRAVTSDPAPPPEMAFKEVVSVGGRMTLGVVVGFQVLDSVDNAVFGIFAPEISESLGLTSTEITVVAALAGIMVALAALPLGWLGDRRRRTTIAGAYTLAWAFAAALVGVVQNLWHLVLARVVAGVGKAGEGPIQVSLLTDTYPRAGRGRVLGLHRAAQPLGIVAGPVLAAVFAATVPAEHEPWRWAFAFLALPGLVLGVAALRLREPARGRFDRETPRPVPAPVPLRAAFARLREIRTFTFVLIAMGAFGLCVVAVPIHLTFILEDRLGQGMVARSTIFAISAVGGLVGAALAGVHSDRLFRRSPTTALHLAAGALAALGIGFAFQAYSPDVATFVVIGTLTQGMLFAGIVPLSITVAAITPPEIRATAFALVGFSLAFVGGLGGAVATRIAESLWGAQAAIAAIAPTASIAAGLVLVAGARHLPRDIRGNGTDEGGR
ncbi:MFS transporter [Umezawaea endophytica]|uniref:MFS transporter n=1 Tax=Umezawaea endophytica TaxID=1654476 RepID=A0A9X2VFV0_9PSEU|nr:MFS transporter [Umezawaea endophytica]MCS7475811.1 MFS transporter [Umezawaea endophytica]